jgi:predicted MFS family arabinose efflux permease
MPLRWKSPRYQDTSGPGHRNESRRARDLPARGVCPFVHHVRVRPGETLASPLLWLAFLTMMLVSGIANAFPVFLPPLLDEFGGSRAATASTVSLFWLFGAMLGPVTGRLMDRRSPRAVVATGLVATALGMAGAALAGRLSTFTLVLGAGGGIGIGLTGLVSQAAVMAEAYERRRGFATGIAFSGSMLGYALGTPAHRAITAVGWRWTLVGWAVIVLALVPPVLVWYPKRLTRHAEAAGHFDRAAARRIVLSRPFWMLVVVTTTAPLVGYLMTVQHLLYLGDLGFSADEAALMLLLGGVLSTAGRALSGLTADRFGAETTGLVSLACSLVGGLCLTALEVSPSRVLAYGYVVFVFLPLGSRGTIVSVLVSRIAPPGRFGSVFGLLIVGNNAGAALGPILSGAIYDATRSYLAIYLAGMALLMLALVALVVFIRTTRRTVHRQ